MALFNLFKKKEEKKAPTCCCNAEPQKEEHSCCCGSHEKAEHSCCCGSHEKVETSCCCGKPIDGICCIKVLGAGCKACHEQYDYALEAVKNLNLDVPVEYITDLEKIMDFGVMTMPAIVINETVATAGKVLKTRDVENLLRSFHN